MLVHGEVAMLQLALLLLSGIQTIPPAHWLVRASQAKEQRVKAVLKGSMEPLARVKRTRRRGFVCVKLAAEKCNDGMCMSADLVLLRSGNLVR